MSEQKDEFENYLEHEIFELNKSLTIQDFEIRNHVLIHSTAYQTVLEKYQQIKAKNVCKNCQYILANLNRQIYPYNDHCVKLRIYVNNHFSCNEFKHAN